MASILIRRSELNTRQGRPASSRVSTAVSRAARALCWGVTPVVAKTSPRRYSCSTLLRSSVARYSADVIRDGSAIATSRAETIESRPVATPYVSARRASPMRDSAPSSSSSPTAPTLRRNQPSSPATPNAWNGTTPTRAASSR